jgi:hypothetical protein
MADPTILRARAPGLIAARLRALWNRDILAAAANGWTVTSRRWARVVVRDPRFNLIHECADCGGTGIYCSHEDTPCSACRQPCSKCRGRGTVRERPLRDLPVPEPLIVAAGGGRRAQG